MKTVSMEFLKHGNADILFLFLHVHYKSICTVKSQKAKVMTKMALSCLKQKKISSNLSDPFL